LDWVHRRAGPAATSPRDRRGYLVDVDGLTLAVTVITRADDARVAGHQASLEAILASLQITHQP